METRFRRSHAAHSATTGEFNWLLLPGGPGIGSESPHELADAMNVPGQVWLVDLPGSNRAPERMDAFASWPGVLIEAADAVPGSVFLGTPPAACTCWRRQCSQNAFAASCSPPDCSWHAQYVAMTQRHPLPAFERAAEVYSRDKSVASLAALAVASAEWNFTARGLDAGRELLARMPYNSDAMEWSDANFDHTYRAAWWPTEIPAPAAMGRRRSHREPTRLGRADVPDAQRHRAADCRCRSLSVDR